MASGTGSSPKAKSSRSKAKTTKGPRKGPFKANQKPNFTRAWKQFEKNFPEMANDEMRERFKSRWEGREVSGVYGRLG